jgi:uncharacterized protein
MRARQLGERGGFRTFALVFETDDDAVAGLLRFADDHAIDAAGLTGIGAARRAAVGWYDPDRRDYGRIEVEEQVEILSLLGDITGPGAMLGSTADAAQGRTVHAHVVLARRDGSTVGGHLLEAIVRPTLEILVTETPSVLSRRHDAPSGLVLIDLDTTPGG